MASSSTGEQQTMEWLVPSTLSLSWRSGLPGLPPRIANIRVRSIVLLNESEPPYSWLAAYRTLNASTRLFLSLIAPLLSRETRSNCRLLSQELLVCRRQVLFNQIIRQKNRLSTVRNSEV